jgi:hypothetical protein
MKKTFNKIKKLFKVFGPGVVTGAADDEQTLLKIRLKPGRLQYLQQMVLMMCH